MAMASAAPDLHIPPSGTTVSVRIINTTAHISNISYDYFVTPHIKGVDTITAPAYSFLIEHPSSRKLLFDLGVRKDHENLPPIIANRIRDENWGCETEKDVREILEEDGVSPDDVEGIIWSHFHWDHTGDPSTFSNKTALIVGPGFKDKFTPGYPANPDAGILESDYEGRELREITFSQGIKVGNFDAFDYFGDGSFYILDSPGHTTAHICALARVTTSPDSFIFMGGDACHHAAEFRPSKYLPLPASISPNPLDLKSLSPCPGSLFSDILRDGDTRRPFFNVVRYNVPSPSGYDPDVAEATIEKIIETDARPDILIVMAHDETLLNVVDFFPKYANDFVEKRWVDKSRRLLLKDFAKAVEK
jgi:glyoxylase-like metal-dependent hydrolase (beta-lactamase superfamily II)